LQVKRRNDSVKVLKEVKNKHKNTISARTYKTQKNPLVYTNTMG